MTVVGFLALAGLALAQNAAKICLKKDLGVRFHKNACTVIAEVGGNWGGCSLGPVALCGSYSEKSAAYFEDVRRHEFGHSLQHCLLGPLFIFIVQIPSASRYWYYTLKSKAGRTFPADWYDSIWFEGSATSWGNRAVIWFESAPASSGFYFKARVITAHNPDQAIRLYVYEQNKVVEGYVYNKNRDWSLIKQSIGQIIRVKLNIMAGDTVLIMEVCE